MCMLCGFRGCLCPLLRLMGVMRRMTVVTTPEMVAVCAAYGAHMPNQWHEDLALSMYFSWRRN